MIDLPIRRGYDGPNRVSTSQFLRMRPLWLNYDGSEKLTDFQVKCVLTPSDIPFEKLRADKQDLLFVDNNNEPIPYWIEQADSTEIIVWLKFSEIIPGKEVFWLYYGNRNFSGASDGFATFEFFDDFEDGDVSDWENPIAITTNAYQGQYAAKVPAGSDPHPRKPFTYDSDIVIEWAGNSEDGAGYCGVEIFDSSGNWIRWSFTADLDKMWIESNLFSKVSASQTFDGNTWYNFKAIYKTNGYMSIEYEGNILKTTQTYITPNKLGLSRAGSYDELYDIVRVRKYTSPEPSVSV